MHVSSTSQRVPRTVADEYEPLVRKRPLPSPHSRRLRRFAAAFALPAPQLSLSVSRSEVRGFEPFVCVSLNVPS